jgi:hypothetical protein
MPVERLLLELVIILAAAKIGSEIAERFNQPAVQGELCAGFAVGLYVFGPYVTAPNSIMIVGAFAVSLVPVRTKHTLHFEQGIKRVADLFTPPPPLNYVSAHLTHQVRVGRAYSIVAPTASAEVIGSSAGDAG